MRRATWRTALALAALGLLLPATATAAQPSAAALVQQSTAAVRLVHQVHADAVLSSSVNGFSGRVSQSLQFHLTGDCDAQHHAVHLRFHVRGTKRTGKGPPERLDARYIFIISPSSGGTSRERFWERSARTRNRWEPVDPSFLVQEPEYTAYLDAYPCPDERIVSLVPLTRFRYLGEAVVNGHPTWHVAGAVTRGDSVEVNLYVDRQSRRWDRIAVTFAQRLGGHLIGRQPSTVDYSRFNQPVHITAPVTGATSP